MQNSTDIKHILSSALVIGYELCIRNSFNTYIWDDLMDQSEPMKIIITYDTSQYEGMLYNFESYSNSPHITLASYIVRDFNKLTTKNYTDDHTKVVILDSSTTKCIEIIYSKNNIECQTIKNFCDYRKSIQNEELKSNKEDCNCHSCLHN